MAITLRGSARRSLPGAIDIAAADATERLEVSILVRRRAASALAARAAALARGHRGEPCMSREEFARTHGADPADFAAVRAFVTAHGLVVVQEHEARRTLVVAGTVAAFSTAFAVQLQQMSYAGGTYRGRVGEVTLPSELQDVIEAVLGLDNRPQAKPHLRISKSAATAASFSPPQIADLYHFPAATGNGECVALIELGGGFRPPDLTTYFSKLGVGAPSVVAVSVDHAQNSPTGNGNGPDGEVMLDVEVVGAIAPQAQIAVYFAPNTDAGFLDAVTTAIHDTTHRPSVISISWGGPESSWTSQAMSAMDSAFQAAATMGISVCVASGDNGSSDGATDGGDHVDFPASSSFALACGGTSLHASTAGGMDSISSEVVWNDGVDGGASGGGVSTFFRLPEWQSGLNTQSSQHASTPLSMRGVPDVAGDADPDTGYQVRVDGTDTVIGGTSAVAPLWAALIARLNELHGKPVGFLNPVLYANPQALRDVTTGNNGDFSAAKGWDACTGLGSPNGAAVLKLL